MTSQYRYLEEMKESGYHADSIDEFHYKNLSHLARTYFPEKTSTVVDIGAGWGHCLIPLKRAGYEKLIAVDIDATPSKRLENEGIKFFTIDINRDRLCFEDSTIDVILNFFVIAQLKDPTNLLNEVFRVLREGGTLILVTPDWRKQYKTFWRDHTHIHPYDKVSIRRLLRCFQFDISCIKSFGAIRGIGLLKLWKLWEPLMFTGSNIIAVATKPSGLSC